MAECVMTQLVKEHGVENEFVIDSAGTSNEEEGNDIFPPAVRKLRAKGVEILPHSAKQLKPSDYGKFDLFLCAEQRNVTCAKRIFGGDKDGKVMRMLDLSAWPRDIDDPWWTCDFETAYDDIVEACESLLEYAKTNEYVKV